MQYSSVNRFSSEDRPLNPPNLGDFKRLAPPGLGAGGPIRWRSLRFALTVLRADGVLGASRNAPYVYIWSYYVWDVSGNLDRLWSFMDRKLFDRIWYGNRSTIVETHGFFHALLEAHFDRVINQINYFTDDRCFYCRKFT